MIENWRIDKKKIKREIEELFYKPITGSKDDMDKFDKQGIKKIRPIKTISFISWLNKVWWERNQKTLEIN